MPPKKRMPPKVTNYVGQRIAFKLSPCTVRYVGEIQGLSGTWLGVEWDYPERGKHSGEHEGVRYFECLSKVPTAGSFIRPNRPSDPAQDFVHAVRQKYASETLGEGEITRNALYQDQPIRISASKTAEEVGFDKIRRQLANLQELRIVLVDGLAVKTPLDTDTLARWEASSEENSTERPDDIRSVCPKIVELDVSRNLFEDWREILYICEQLDQLRDLRANGNRFRKIKLYPDETKYFRSRLSKLKALSLDETYMTWEELIDTANTFPNLNYLSASNNSFKTLGIQVPPSTLTTIILENNGFTSIGDVAPLTSLPNLSRLTLKNNSISTTHTSETTAPIFSESLTSLDISSNDLSTWAPIDALPNVFPGLNSLRISSNPIYDHLVSPADDQPLTADDGYILTIARLGPVHTLNFSSIPEKERTNAELWYLSLITAELARRPVIQAQEVLASHPRYSELCTKYDRDPDVALQNAGKQAGGNSNALSARLVTVVLKLSPAAAAQKRTELQDADEVGDETLLEIPKSFSVYAALGLVGKRFGLWPMGIRLVWETGEWDYERERSAEDGIVEWDSENEDEGEGEGAESNRIKREVVIEPSTRPFGTQVDGERVVVRVELRDEA